MECSLGKAEWMCQRCCDGCEHSITVKPVDNVQIYADGKRAKVIPVTLRILLSSALLLSPLWC